MSIAFLHAVPRFFRQKVLLIRAGEAEPGLFGIEDEDAVIIERDFFGLPGGFVAVARVLPVEADFIVIGRNPLFDGLPGRLEGFESLIRTSRPVCAPCGLRLRLSNR